VKLFHSVGTVAEVPTGACKVAQFGQRFVAVFNLDGQFHAIDHECPHQGGPLGGGELHGRIVLCPWHGWAFDVTTGHCPTSPDLCVEQFPVRVVGDQVQVELDAESAPGPWDW